MRGIPGITFERLNIHEGPFIALVYGLAHRARSYGLDTSVLKLVDEGWVFDRKRPPRLLQRWVESISREGARKGMDCEALRKEIIADIEVIEARCAEDERVFDVFETTHFFVGPSKAWLIGLFGDPDGPRIETLDLEALNSALIERLRRHPDDLYRMRPRVFEELIAELLASKGWEVVLTAATRDGGYDIFAISKEPKTGVTSSWLIECKRYAPDRKVGIDEIRSLFAVKLDLHVGSVMVATTSHFSRDAEALKTSRYDLELKDSENILGWINSYRPNPSGRLYIKDQTLVLPA